MMGDAGTTVGGRMGGVRSKAFTAPFVGFPTVCPHGDQ